MVSGRREAHQAARGEAQRTRLKLFERGLDDGDLLVDLLDRPAEIETSAHIEIEREPATVNLSSGAQAPILLSVNTATNSAVPSTFSGESRRLTGVPTILKFFGSLSLMSCGTGSLAAASARSA